MWLVGMMGSGKTSVGRETASRVRARFYDTDEMVEEKAGMRISAIWDGIGEAGFRELERHVISSIPDSDFVAAAGGGAVLARENRDHMRRGEPVVWLQTSPHHLAARLRGDDERPLLQGEGSDMERMSVLLEERWDHYSEVATEIVNTDDRDLEDVISEVVALWRR